MSEKLREIVKWLRNEAATRVQDARSRREGKGNRDATEAELKAAKKMAEKMFRRKLDLVSTDPEENRRNYDMQERITAKLEAEAKQLSEWAEFLENLSGK